MADRGCAAGATRNGRTKGGGCYYVVQVAGRAIEEAGRWLAAQLAG